MTDLERLVELVRAVADDPTTTYKPTRTFEMAKKMDQSRTAKRRADEDRRAAEVLAWAAPRFLR